MTKIVNFRDFAGKRKGEEYHLYTVKEFKAVMNGTGYDDSEFKISIAPFTDPDDHYIEGWFLTFIHAEEDQFCVVAEDDHNGTNDFILYHKPIGEIFEILNSLSSCPRTITVHHNNDYKNQD